MAERLTDKRVRELEAPAKGQRRIKDTEVTGFGVVVRANGSRSYILDYTYEGRERRKTIGQFGTWKTAPAREEARGLRKMVDRGQDPLAAQDERRKAETVNALADLYERDHLPDKRDAAKDREMLNKYVRPKLGKSKVVDLKRSDIRKVHRDITDEGKPTRANRVLALLSKMFTMAVQDYQMRSDNPCKGLPRNEENRRERYLSQEEIGRLFDVLAEYKHQRTANVIRMLVLTGARKSEVLTMRWKDVDLAEGVWIKPSSATKQKKSHRIPLSAPALQLLSELEAQRAEGDTYVFPGTRAGEPMKSIKNAWSTIRERAGLDDVRPHDLRHSFASLLIGRGASLALVGRLLGHSTPQTTARYAHLADEPLREAVDTVGAAVTGAQRRPENDSYDANVIPISNSG